MNQLEKAAPPEIVLQQVIVDFFSCFCSYGALFQIPAACVGVSDRRHPSALSTQHDGFIGW